MSGLKSFWVKKELERMAIGVNSVRNSGFYGASGGHSNGVNVKMQDLIPNPKSY